MCMYLHVLTITFELNDLSPRHLEAVVKVGRNARERRSGVPVFVPLAFLAPKQVKLNGNARSMAPNTYRIHLAI